MREFDAEAMRDARDRRRTRRRFAQAAAGQVILLVGCLIFGAFDDATAERLLKLNLVYMGVISALLTYLGHYTHVGSQETKLQIGMIAKTGTNPPGGTE